jgi:hypothetical protein
MAKMGKGKLTKGLNVSPEKADISIPLMAVNLISGLIHVQPVATLGFEQPALGAPIMPEGFVTETGFLPGSGQQRFSFVSLGGLVE